MNVVGWSDTDAVDSAIGDRAPSPPPAPGARFRLVSAKRGLHRIHGRQRSATRVLDDGRELRFVRHRNTGFLRTAHGDDAVAIGHPVAGKAVDVGEGDLGQEALDEPVLIRDTGDRLLLHEVADELVGERL